MNTVDHTILKNCIVAVELGIHIQQRLPLTGLEKKTIK